MRDRKSDLSGPIRHRAIRLAALATAVALLSGVLFAEVAGGQQPQTSASVLAERRFEAADPPDRFSLVQVVAELGPTLATPRFTPGGQAFVTVIEGALILSGEEGERAYLVGEGFSAAPGPMLALSNAEPATARFLMTFLLPDEAPLTMLEGTAGSDELPPGPALVARAIFLLADRPDELEVVHRIVDFAPGAVVPAHTHPGPSFVTLLSGDVQLCIGGADHRFASAETWVEPNGVPHSGVNGAERARVAATTLVPKGMPVAKPARHCTDAARPDGGAPSGGSASSGRLSVLKRG